MEGSQLTEWDLDILEEAMEHRDIGTAVEVYRKLRIAMISTHGLDKLVDNEKTPLDILLYLIIENGLIGSIYEIEKEQADCYAGGPDAYIHMRLTGESQ